MDRYLTPEEVTAEVAALEADRKEVEAEFRPVWVLFHRLLDERQAIDRRLGYLRRIKRPKASPRFAY